MSDAKTKDIHLQVCLKSAAWYCANQQYANPSEYRKHLIGITEAVFNDYEALCARVIPNVGAPLNEQSGQKKQPPFPNNQGNQNQNQGTSQSQVSNASKGAKCNKCGEPITWTKIQGQNTPKNLDGSNHWDTCQADPGENFDPNGPEYNTGSSVCKKCEETIWWKTSQTSGKNYPVNQDGSYHSGSCSGQPQSQGSDQWRNDDVNDGQSQAEVDDIPF